MWRSGKVYDWSTEERRIKIGSYNLNSIKPGIGITAGCHFINAQEIECFARVLGLTDDRQEQTASTESSAA